MRARKMCCGERRIVGGEDGGEEQLSVLDLGVGDVGGSGVDGGLMVWSGRVVAWAMESTLWCASGEDGVSMVSRMVLDSIVV